MTFSHDIPRPGRADPEEHRTMHDRRTAPSPPRPRRTRETATLTPQSVRFAQVAHEERVEVAVLGALGRLARRLGAAPLSIAR